MKNMKNGKLLLILALILCLGASCLAGLLPAPAEASMPPDPKQENEERMQLLILGEAGPELEKYKNRDVHENSPIPSDRITAAQEMFTRKIEEGTSAWYSPDTSGGQSAVPGAIFAVTWFREVKDDAMFKAQGQLETRLTPAGVSANADALTGGQKSGDLLAGSAANALKVRGNSLVLGVMPGVLGQTGEAQGGGAIYMVPSGGAATLTEDGGIFIGNADQTATQGNFTTNTDAGYGNASFLNSTAISGYGSVVNGTALYGRSLTNITSLGGQGVFPEPDAKVIGVIRNTDGGVSVQLNTSADVVISDGAEVDQLNVEAGAEGSSFIIDGTSQVNLMQVAADNVAIQNDGTVGTLTAGNGVNPEITGSGTIISTEQIRTEGPGDVPTVCIYHTWGEPTYIWSDSNQSCISVKKCETCGVTMRQKLQVKVVSSIEPTCTKPGSKVYAAKNRIDVMFETESEPVEVPPLGHAWGAWQPYKASTCAKQGKEIHWCSRCNERDDRPLPLLPHTQAYENDTAATCTTSGYSGGSYCTVCRAILSSGHTIPALGHAWGSWTQTKAPTCTEPGVETRTCTRAGCGMTQTRQISTGGHTPVNEPGEEATCTQKGWSAWSYCSVCETVLEVQKEIPALDHAWGSWTQTKAPTCTEPGVETRTCTRAGCGMTQTRQISTGGHTPVNEPGEEATCTQKGWSAWSYCSVCETVLEVQKEIPALGHDWGEWGDSTATCTEPGVETRTCRRIDCGATESREVPAKGHILGVDNVCTVCNEPVEMIVPEG